MEGYIALIIMIILLNVILKMFYKNNDYSKKFLNITFLILFLFLALRSENVGTDLLTYKNFFNYNESFKLSKLLQLFEPGYSLYSYFIYNLTGGNFRIFIIITAFLTLIGPYHFIKNYSKNYFLSVIAYICLNYYLFTFSGLRQSIAVSLLLFSIDYIRDKKLFKFLIINVIACSFHKSSLVFLPAYFLGNLNVKRKHLPIVLSVYILIFFLRVTITECFTNLFYETYNLVETPKGGEILLVVYLCIYVFISYYKDIIIKSDKEQNLLYNLFSIGIVFQIFATVEANANRVTLYYVVPLVSLIPLCENCFVKENRKLINIIFSIILIAYFILNLEKSSLVSSYSFFWI